MKKIITVALSAAILLGVFCASAYASFGSGLEVIKEESELVKTGIFGKKLGFSDLDFKQGLAISDFDSITVTRLPASSEGTLMLAGRRVSEGTKIRRKNIAALVFIPTTSEVSEASFGFTVEPGHSNDEINFKLRFTDKINYEPEAKNEEETALTTQRDISIYGKMSAIDPEGDLLEFIIVSFPEYGSVEVLNRETGEFRYTPKAGFVGEDNFVYIARDEWGNYSVTMEASVTVTERHSEVEYVDMEGSREYNAAVALTAAGIMDGRTVGDGKYFMPDDGVTRAEFVSMAMKALGIRQDSTLKESYFDDNDEIPKALVSYVATAQKAGFITGSFEEGRLIFSPNDNITLCEAACIMREMLGERVKADIPVFGMDCTVPYSAREDCYILCSVGIIEKEFDSITESDVLSRRMCADYLYKLMNM